MNFHKNRLIHWIAAIAIAMSALAPAMSQAVSLAQGGHGFAMEICAVDGSKMQITVQTEGQLDQAEQAPLFLHLIPTLHLGRRNPLHSCLSFFINHPSRSPPG
jgi:hypothetical protein